MAFRRRGVALLLVITTALGLTALVAACGGDESPVTDGPPSGVIDDTGGDPSVDPDATQDQSSDVIDATDENLEYPYYECADVDGDGIPDGPWDCDDNGIPDEDEDGGFLP